MQPQPIVVKVNTRSVTLEDHKVTGRQIKEAAIAQGVAIQLTFALFRVTGSTQHQVRDDEIITVHNNLEFRAVAADDNS